MEEFGFEIIDNVVDSSLLLNAKNGIDNWLREYCGVDINKMILDGVKDVNWPSNKH